MTTRCSPPPRRSIPLAAWFAVLAAAIAGVGLSPREARAAVGAGASHTCSITPGGGVLCWGYNFDGQLGDQTTVDRWVPAPVAGLASGIKGIGAGADHTCAMTTGGSVRCWGYDMHGELGTGERLFAATPVSVYGLGGEVSVLAVSPANGSQGGGVVVTLSGAHMLLGVTVTIGGVAASGVTVVNPTAVVAATGAHPAGPVEVVVLNPDGRHATLVDGFSYDVAQTTVVLGSLTQTYDGTPRVVTATTTPPGLPVAFSYTGIGGTTYGPSATPPVNVGTYSVTGTIIDPNYVGSATGTLSVVGGQPPAIVTASLPAGKVAGAYSQVLTAAGGVAPYTWTQVSGTLPPGLALSAAGVLSGKPLIAGTYDFRIRVTGADGASSEKDLSLTVGLFRRYFAEGASSGFFDCYFALANPGSTTTANITLSFLRYDSQTFVHTETVPPLTRSTVNVKSVPGMALAFGFSTILESNVEVVADRTMSWDATGYGSHAETSIKEPAQTWYLAEGATQNGFQLYYLIENPNPDPVDVRLTYLRRSPNPPFDILYPAIPGYTRKTIYVNDEDPRLASGDVSGVVTSLTPGGPIIVERAMYLNSENRQFNAGHDSAGVTAPATDWFLAEGATVGTFDMFILLANPGDVGGTATVTYMLTDGRTLVKSYPVDARSRQTVWVNGESDNSDPTFTLSNISLSAMVHSTVPIIVERAMWWSAVPNGPWIEAHNAVGVTETGTMWAVADGEQGGSRNTDTYVLVANTSPFPGRVRVTVMGEDGSTPWIERDMPANSRSTFYMGGEFGGTLAGKKFGVIVESLSVAQGTAAIVVERAMYSNANGVVWAGGTDVVATKLK